MVHLDDVRYVEAMKLLTEIVLHAHAGMRGADLAHTEDADQPEVRRLRQIANSALLAMHLLDWDSRDSEQS